MSDYRGNRVVPKLIKNNGTNNILLDLLLNYNVPISVNGTLNVAGLISGQKGISLSSGSNGTLNLSNQNTYAGSTIINSGTLKLSGSGSLGGPSATYSGGMVINGTLDHSSSVDQIITGVIDRLPANASPSCKIIVNGPGMLNFRNPFGYNLFDGTLQINSGAYVKVGNNDAINNPNIGLGTGSIHLVTSIISNGTLEFNRGTGSSAANVNGSVSGSGLIKLTGASSIIMAGGGDFSGNVLINSGTVLTLNRVMNSAIFENNGTLTLNATSSWNPNYVFNTTINGNTTSLIYLTDYVAGTSIGAANITAQVQSAGLGNSASEFAGFVPGRIALVQRGVQSFQVKVNNAIAAGASAVIIYNNTTGITTPSVTTNIPVVMITQSLGQQFVAALNTTTVSCRIDTSSSSVPFNNTISGNGTIVKSGDSPLVMNIGSAYTGIISITGGTARFSTTNSLYNGNTASWTNTKIVVNTGATFAINVGGTNEFTTSDVSTLLTNLLTTINNNGLRSGSSIGFDTSNSVSDFNISSNITNSTGTGAGAVGVRKLGTGTLVLSGSANTYTGGTVINGGTLKAGNATCFGTGTITLNPGATLDRAGFTINNTVVNNGGTIIN